MAFVHYQVCYLRISTATFLFTKQIACL